MGLISRVSSRTYREMKFFKKAASNIAVKFLAVATPIFAIWAFFYDRYRRNKPDYKKKLVEKRRAELKAKRERADPLYYLKSIPPCESFNAGQQQLYMMAQCEKGEQSLSTGDFEKGAAHIAMGLAFLSGMNLHMALQQLSMTIPTKVFTLVRDYLPTAKARTQTEMIRLMTARSEANGATIIETDDQGVPIEPQDVDSIDGDNSIKSFDNEELPASDSELEEESWSEKFAKEIVDGALEVFELGEEDDRLATGNKLAPRETTTVGDAQAVKQLIAVNTTVGDAQAGKQVIA